MVQAMTKLETAMWQVIGQAQYCMMNLETIARVRMGLNQIFNDAIYAREISYAPLYLLISESSNLSYKSVTPETLQELGVKSGQWLEIKG